MEGDERERPGRKNDEDDDNDDDDDGWMDGWMNFAERFTNKGNKMI